MMNRFSESLLLLSPITVRSLTVRKNITYGVVVAPQSDLVAAGIVEVRKALEAIWLCTTDERARGIFYCRTKDGVRRVGRELDCSVYYADSGTEEEKAEVIEGWMRGDSKLMVATTAFTEGVDHRYVRIIIYIGPPESVIEFVQGVGCGDRDGQAVYVVWYFREGGNRG